MKATMAMGMDTPWANKVELMVESELDNPHALVTAEITKLMVYTIKTMALQVRHENERWLVSHHQEVLTVGEPFRERERFEEMERDRDLDDEPATTRSRRHDIDDERQRVPERACPNGHGLMTYFRDDDEGDYYECAICDHRESVRRDQ